MNSISYPIRFFSIIILVGLISPSISYSQKFIGSPVKIDDDALYQEIKLRWKKVKDNIIEENINRLVGDFGPSIREILKDMFFGITKIDGTPLKNRITADLLVLYFISERIDKAEKQNNGALNTKILSGFSIDLSTYNDSEKLKIKQDYIFLEFYNILLNIGFIRDHINNSKSIEGKVQTKILNELENINNSFSFSKIEIYEKIRTDEIYIKAIAKEKENRKKGSSSKRFWENSESFQLGLENIFQNENTRNFKIYFQDFSSIISKTTTQKQSIQAIKTYNWNQYLSSIKTAGKEYRVNFTVELLKKIKDELPLNRLCNNKCPRELKKVLISLQKFRTYIYENNEGDYVFDTNNYIKDQFGNFDETISLKRGFSPYLAIGISSMALAGGNINCFDNEECKNGDFLEFYSEKLGIKYVWDTYDDQSSLYTNFYVGGLLSKLKAKEVDKQPFDPEGFYQFGVDILGYNFYGLIEANVSVQYLFDGREDTYLVGFNTAIDLKDYFNLIAE